MGCADTTGKLVMKCQRRGVEDEVDVMCDVIAACVFSKVADNRSRNCTLLAVADYGIFRRLQGLSVPIAVRDSKFKSLKLRMAVVQLNELDVSKDQLDHMALTWLGT